MTGNTEHASIFEALAAAQAEFKAPNKTKKAAYGMYADLAEILAAVRPALNAHGIYLFQKVTSDGVNVSVETVLGYKTGEVLSSGVLTMPVVRLGSSSSSAQGIGATRTYACRYSLSTFLGIAADDDNDGSNLDDGKQKSQPKGRSNQKAPAKPAASPAPRAAPAPAQEPIEGTYPDTAALEAAASEAASRGTEPYKEWFSSKLTKHERKQLVDSGFHEKCKQAAAEADNSPTPL
jgi:hypothetical protein